MGRFPISTVAVFLAGTLAGALATGGLRPALDATQPADPIPLPETDVPSRTPDGEVGNVTMTAATQNLPMGASDRATEQEDSDRDGLKELMLAWTKMQEDLLRLQGRVSGLEQKLAASAPVDESVRPDRPATEQDRRALLLRSGVAMDVAAEIVSREAQNELDRLELRDLALREGWFGSERYREEVGRLDEERPDLRTEIGEEAYDRYLYSAGADNRVRVNSVIPGSAAEEAGLGAGDLIETYDGGRIFTFSGLRNATAAGERGELVPVDIRRQDGSRLQAWLPRGPLGVRLDLTRADPDA